MGYFEKLRPPSFTGYKPLIAGVISSTRDPLRVLDCPAQFGG